MSTDKNLSYLVKLIGRKVRTYKGGPESKEGLLLHVKQDYIALLTEDNNVIYYQTRHLKSVVEDSKTSIEPTTNSEEYEILEADSFNEILKLMEFKNVQVDRGGPESLTGTLLGISDNFLTLQSENNGDVHYQIHHIKSVSVEKGEAAENPTPYVAPAENFSSLLNSFQHSWVTINRGGPESIEGVLAEMTKSFVTIIHHEKIFRLTEYHIRNISQGSKHDKKKQQENSESQQENQTDNQTGNNSKKQENQKNKENNSTNEKNKKQQQETTTSQQEVTKNNSSDKNNKQKQETTSKQQEEAKNNSSNKNNKQKQETTSNQQEEAKSNSSNKNNKQKQETTSNQQEEAKNNSSNKNNKQKQETTSNQQEYARYSSSDKNNKQKQETTSNQQEYARYSSSDKNNKQKQETTSKQQEYTRYSSSDKNNKQKQETTSKQQAVTSNASAIYENNRKREVYDMLMKQVSSNLEATLKKAQNRINN